MDDDATSIEEVEEDIEFKNQSDEDDLIVFTKKHHKKSSLFKFPLFLLLILVLMIAAACAVYIWREKVATDIEMNNKEQIMSLNSEISNLKSQLASLQSGNNSSTDNGNGATVCNPVYPNFSAIENIRASITTGNTAVLEGYMAKNVTVILAATEAYGFQTPIQAVLDITSFISDSKSPWDFLLSASILSSYGKGDYGKYFTTIDTVGKSADGKVISFLFDCDAKISTVFMSPSDSLLK